MSHGLRPVVPIAAVLFILGCAPNRDKPSKIDLESLCRAGETQSIAPFDFDARVARAINSTVKIHSVAWGDAWYSSIGQYRGTGVIVDQKAGLILTAAHVVHNAVKLEITTLHWDKKEGVVEDDDLAAVVLSRDEGSDTAVLMV